MNTNFYCMNTNKISLHKHKILLYEQKYLLHEHIQEHKDHDTNFLSRTGRELNLDKSANKIYMIYRYEQQIHELLHAN